MYDDGDSLPLGRTRRQSHLVPGASGPFTDLGPEVLQMVGPQRIDIRSADALCVSAQKRQIHHVNHRGDFHHLLLDLRPQFGPSLFIRGRPECLHLLPDRVVVASSQGRPICERQSPKSVAVPHAAQ